jgi:prepilin-type N-terminal cleavage/methylation domain-containing protein
VRDGDGQHINPPHPNPLPEGEGTRRAFTLLEVVLVLALIVVLAALTLPALEGPLATRRLQSAADQVRTTWTRARLWAVDSGQVQVFTCDVAAGTYRVESLGDQLEASRVVPASDESQTTVPRAPGYEGRLPEEVVFYLGTADASTPQASSVAAQGADGIPPLVFYPDGTCSTAEVWLANASGQAIPVRLRGLTGTAMVGEVQRLEERP